MTRAALPFLALLSAGGGALPAATERPLRSVVAPLPAGPWALAPPASSQPAAASQTGATSEPAPAPPSRDLVFVVGGDNRPTGKGAPLPRLLSTLFEEIGWIHPDLVLWTGDTVYGYCDTRRELEGELDDFLAQAGAAGVPLFNAPGNHEIHNGQSCGSAVPADALCAGACAEEAFRGRFGNLYGSFDYAGVHFIALDTSAADAEDTIAGDQLAWLERDLEQNRGARAIFVFCHTEFFGSPRIDPPDDKSHPPVTNRTELHALFRRYPVKAVFSGHEHVFWQEPPDQHDGIAYFVAGGAGAPAYASPDRGGFAHYLVVRLPSAPGSQPSYEPVEPGRLSFAPAAAGPARRSELGRQTSRPRKILSNA